MNTLATIELGDAGLWALNQKVDKLNKRAKRHNMNELKVTVVREFTTVHEDSGCEVRRYDVEIDGSAPCINGWYLAARIENSDIIGTNVRVVPGPHEDDDYSGYRDFDFSRDVCDHCNTCRRRNDVFVIINSEGHRKVIGRNCLADYLRCENAEDFARYAAFVDECGSFTDDGLSEYASEGGFGGRGYRPVIGLVSYLEVVQCCTRRIGWTSRSAAYDNPGLTATADDAYFVIFGGGRHHKEFIEGNELYVNDKDRDIAVKAVQWAQSLTEEQTRKSEYLHTIRRIAIAEVTDDKLAGYAASIIRAYQKDQEYAAERAEKSKNAKTKVWFGSEGERVRDLVVKVLRVRYIDSDYGVRTIVAMETVIDDETIAPLVWFASGEKDFEEGKEYTLTGTIKKHDDGQYGKQTALSRCKLA